MARLVGVMAAVLGKVEVLTSCELRAVTSVAIRDVLPIKPFRMGVRFTPRDKKWSVSRATGCTCH